MKRTRRTPSQRQLKMGEQVRQLLSTAILKQGLLDPMGRPLTVTFTEVRCSPDLRLAKAYYVPLGQVPEETCEQALKTALPYLQAALARNSKSKFTPRLTFCYDRSFDRVDQLREVLATLPEANSSR